MSKDHYQSSNLSKQLGLGFVLNTAFTIFEFAAGFLSGSLALISDASHNLSDSVSLVIAFIGNKASERKADDKRTYGYGRASIISALINATILLVLSGYILFEAYQRFMTPQPVKGGVVVVVAFLGILVNATIAAIFYQQSKNDLNIRGAFINMAFDALASVGALVAGVLLVITGKTYFDPLISSFIALMLLFSTYKILRDVLHVLLEGVPENINIEQVKAMIKSHSQVTAVDDLHIWAISSQYSALSCHICVETDDIKSGTKIVDSIKQELKQRFNVQHATIEIELEGAHNHEAQENSN